MTTFKEVAHLYLPFETESWFDGIRLERTVDSSSLSGMLDSKAKPILRPLSDLREDEKYFINELEQKNTSYPTMAVALAPHFVYMLKQGFDLFQLIENGIAIDKTKITNHAN